MGEQTGISWTDHTWNPWHGCLKVSPGCKLCYMYRDKARYGQDPMVVTRSKTTFKDPLKWDSGRVFTCSWSDFFIEQADEWRDEAWAIILQTPHLIYQVLTKRPENIRTRLPPDWGSGYPNVWLGVSAENQEYAEKRIPKLLQTPAAIRFVSAEPLLGGINFYPSSVDGMPSVNMLTGADWCDPPIPPLDWVICGGESGPGARPMFIQWAEDIRQQCSDTGVKFFMKQLGSGRPSWHDGKRARPITGKGDKPSEWPENLRVQEFPA